jgi:hypothetical protein
MNFILASGTSHRSLHVNWWLRGHIQAHAPEGARLFACPSFSGARAPDCAFAGARRLENFST